MGKKDESDASLTDIPNVKLISNILHFEMF